MTYFADQSKTFDLFLKHRELFSWRLFKETVVAQIIKLYSTTLYLYLKEICFFTFKIQL